MSALLVASTLLATIVVTMAFGVLLGYTVILAILKLFGGVRRRQPAQAGTSTAVLVPVISEP